MKVRNAQLGDVSQIRHIHEDMGLDYQFPALDSPLFITRKVVEDENGKVIGACFLRLTAETYLWLSPESSARDKIVAMEAMQPEVLRDAYNKGIDDIEARIPPSVETRFQKMLGKLGWSKNRGWSAWSRCTE